MKRLFILLLLCWFQALSQAEPLRLEAQAGLCKQGIAPDGTWYSTYYPTDIAAKTTCYSLGLSQAPWKYQDWAFGWRVAYVNFGKVKADNQFTFLEPQHPGVSGEDCDSRTHEGCRGRGRITQKTQGITLGGLIERSWGDLTLGMEGGGFYYYGVFEVNVTSHPDSSTLPAVYAKWGSRHLTGYYGGTAKYGYLFATGRVYGRVRADEEGCGGCTGLANGKVWQATIGMQVPW